MLHLPIRIREPNKTAKAAQSRVVSNVVPDLRRLLHQLWCDQTEFFRRPFDRWHYHSVLHVLKENQESLIAAGINTAASQALVREQLVQNVRAGGYMEGRLRKKIARWDLEGPIRHLVERASNTFAVIAHRCRPCVLASLFRIIWNGCPTSYRMRGLGKPVLPCLLGCQSGIDKLEHYAVCETVWTFYAAARPSGLGLPICLRSVKAFLTLEAKLSDDQKVALAIGAYATSRTIQCCRASQGLNAAVLLRLYATRASYSKTDARL